MAEYLAYIQQVIGSSPIVPTKSEKEISFAELSYKRHSSIFLFKLFKDVKSYAKEETR